MLIDRRRGLCVLTTSLTLFLIALAQPAGAAEKARLRVDDYQIEATLEPHLHQITAKAKVKFTALQDLSVAVFELHNDLRVTKVVDEKGTQLSAERVTQDSTVRVPLPNGLSKDNSMTLTFDYEGQLENADNSPVPGLSLAYIGDDTSYLLYAGRWFPVNGYGLNRFTSTISITIPTHMVAIGSGKMTVTDSAPSKKTPNAVAGKTYTFVSDRPSFPGTIVAGVFQETKSEDAGVDLHVFFKPLHQKLAPAYTDAALKEFTYYITSFGPLPSPTLRVVEMPDDTVPTVWSPEIAGMASRAISEKTNYRLLANTIAHQWWGCSVSPATKEDWWLSDGFSRYSEAMYVEQAAGTMGLEEAVKDMSVGALAYDTVPLSSANKLDVFSPEFQTLVTDKGAMILHMLRWVMGDAKYYQTMRTFATTYAGKSASISDFQTVAEKDYGDKLTWFFTQWLDSTGAPEFKTKYTVYRLGNNKGFRVVGEIAQDLDLFRMPVNLKIDTDGKTEEKRIEVVGTNSSFTVETYGKPRRIVVDPDNRVLKNSTDVKLRASITRGQALIQQNDLAGALVEFNKALDANKNSSLAHYRVAEVFFMQRNY